MCKLFAYMYLVMDTHKKSLAKCLQLCEQEYLLNLVCWKIGAYIFLKKSWKTFFFCVQLLNEILRYRLVYAKLTPNNSSCSHKHTFQSNTHFSVEITLVLHDWRNLSFYSHIYRYAYYVLWVCLPLSLSLETYKCIKHTWISVRVCFLYYLSNCWMLIKELIVAAWKWQKPYEHTNRY